jgi:hypothetical protein
MATKRNEARSIISNEGGPVTHRRSVRTKAAAQSSAPSPAETEDAAGLSEQEEIAKLAYSYWEARGQRGGSPEEDWARAEQEYRQKHATVSR